MRKLFEILVPQFNQYYKNLTPIKKASVVGSFIVLLTAMGVIVMIMSKANYAPLLKNVASDQLSLVVDQLQKKNIPFKLDNEGQTVLIPRSLVYSTQMAIMSEMGNSKVGTIGLELFEKQDFGVTSYAQRINYQRALQGELMRAINTLAAVKRSKVILALPPKKTFLEETASPTASVVLEFNPGKSLAPDQVKGITHLVASAVESLEVKNVTIVDFRGKVLSKNYNSESAVSAELLDIKNKIEQDLEERIESMLAKVVGTGKVIAKVNATINQRHISTLEEKVDPDTTALKSSQTEEELLDGSRTNPAGVPGASANLPGNQDQGQVGFKQNVRKEIKANNFVVPKTVKKIKESAGGLQRISIAVLVDGVTATTTGENGEPVEVWSPRTTEEVLKYENIVKSAIGFNGNRGDSVKIESIRFEQEDFTESEKLLSSLEKKNLLHSLFKWIILGLSLSLFFFIVVRPFVRWITESFQDPVEDILPRTIEELEELQSGGNTLGMPGASSSFEESIDLEKAESELLKERIISLMEADEAKAAGAFSLWLSRREG